MQHGTHATDYIRIRRIYGVLIQPFVSDRSGYLLVLVSLAMLAFQLGR